MLNALSFSIAAGRGPDGSQLMLPLVEGTLGGYAPTVASPRGRGAHERHTRRGAGHGRNGLGYLTVHDGEVVLPLVRGKLGLSSPVETYPARPRG